MMIGVVLGFKWNKCFSNITLKKFQFPIRNTFLLTLHFQQEVKETQYSLSSLGNQLRNATFPVDSVMDQVQFVIHTSLDDMNKTIYEDHLKKLYYKVNGVVYKNETKYICIYIYYFKHTSFI